MSSILSDITLPEQLTLGYAIGRAAGEALTPFIYDLINNANAAAVAAGESRPILAEEAAAVAAEDVAKYDAMQTEATLTGYDSARFAHLYGVSLSAPGTGELLTMLRRSDEVQIDFAHGLRKARLEPQWDAALENLRWQRISATDLAYMVVRGIVPDDGTLGSTLPTHSDTLSLPPQHSIDTLAEAARTGWDAQRFAMLVQRSGLAMAPVMAANAYFRGILSRTDYDLTIARGDLYPSFADPVLQVSRQILTAGEYAELQLRGYYDRATRLANTAKHGMTDADSDLLYDVLGRAPSIKQVYIGLARGGTYDGQPKTIPEPFLSAVERANIRPEWYDIEYANRYSLPSAFVVRQLLRDGAIDAARASTIFQHEGWPPDLADLVAQHYATTTTAAADPHIAKAQTQLWSRTHASYIAGEINDATATTALSAAGVAAAAINPILTLWAHELSLIRKELTATQVRKALNLGIVNPATGQPWTQPDALARLLELGYNHADATVFLQE